MNRVAYLKLISGEKTSFGPALMRLLLRVPEPFYLSGICLRNYLYSKGFLKTHRSTAVVLSVGNITTGGTGKTPLVIWLCNLLTAKGLRCAILTRGYKAIQHSRLKTQNYLDEPAILARSCPGTEVIVNPDRVTGAAEAVSRCGAKVIIMDDGFQHRRLYRDVDIVTIDATRPFGYGKLLPAGLLREPVSSLKRADTVVITRSNQVTESELINLERKLLKANSRIIISRSIHNPVSVESLDGENVGLEKLKGKKAFVFCGIGNPDAFFNTIRNLGAELIGSEVFDDHYHYTENDIKNICSKAQHCKADFVLTTQKDRTKITWLALTNIAMPLLYLTIELKFTTGEEELKDLIEHTLAGKIA